MMLKPKFIHLRPLVLENSWTDEWVPANRGGITVLYENGWFSYAKCSIKDNFCRRIGREVAMRNWREKGDIFPCDGNTYEYFNLLFSTELLEQEIKLNEQSGYYWS